MTTHEPAGDPWQRRGPHPVGPRTRVDATVKDEALVARVLAGDPDPFELLMRRYNQRVYRTVRAISVSDAEAEDAMQQAYLAAYTHLAEFAGRARFSTWLTRIAVHEALARRRRAQRLLTGEEEEPVAPLKSPEDGAADAELRVLLTEAMEALPDGFRAVFVLRAVEEMTSREVAEVLGIAEDTVRTRLFRARALLRQHLAARLTGSTTEILSFHLSRCDRVVTAVMTAIRARAGRP